MDCVLLYNNLAPFQIYCRFLHSRPHSYSTLILGVVPVASDRPCCGQPELRSINLKLISREIMFEVFQPIWSRYLKFWTLQTDRTFTFGRSRSSKVIDFVINRRRVCDFLLVRYSNLGPILHRFGDIAGFLFSWVTPPIFHPNCGVFPLIRSTMLGSARAEALSYLAV